MKGLRLIRERKHITVDELAAKCGVSAQTIAYLEFYDTVKCSTKLLLLLADALGVSLEALLFYS